MVRRGLNNLATSKNLTPDKSKVQQYKPQPKDMYEAHFDPGVLKSAYALEQARVNAELERYKVDAAREQLAAQERIQGNFDQNRELASSISASNAFASLAPAIMGMNVSPQSVAPPFLPTKADELPSQATTMQLLQAKQLMGNSEDYLKNTTDAYIKDIANQQAMSLNRYNKDVAMIMANNKAINDNIREQIKTKGWLQKALIEGQFKQQAANATAGTKEDAQLDKLNKEARNTKIVVNIRGEQDPFGKYKYPKATVTASQVLESPSTYLSAEEAAKGDKLNPNDSVAAKSARKALSNIGNSIQPKNMNVATKAKAIFDELLKDPTINEEAKSKLTTDLPNIISKYLTDRLGLDPNDKATRDHVLYYVIGRIR